MNNVPTIIALITALGAGGVLQSVFTWLRDRKKIAREIDRSDLDKELAKLNTVIERLEADNARSFAERDRLIKDQARLLDEISASEERATKLRARVRALEDELDSVRRSARETENRCEGLAIKLRELVRETTHEDATTRHQGEPNVE